MDEVSWDSFQIYHFYVESFHYLAFCNKKSKLRNFSMVVLKNCYLLFCAQIVLYVYATSFSGEGGRRISWQILDGDYCW